MRSLKWVTSKSPGSSRWKGVPADKADDEVVGSCCSGTDRIPSSRIKPNDMPEHQPPKRFLCPERSVSYVLRPHTAVGAVVVSRGEGKAGHAERPETAAHRSGPGSDGARRRRPGAPTQRQGERHSETAGRALGGGESAACAKRCFRLTSARDSLNPEGRTLKHVEPREVKIRAPAFQFGSEASGGVLPALHPRPRDRRRRSRALIGPDVPSPPDAWAWRSGVKECPSPVRVPGRWQWDRQ